MNLHCGSVCTKVGSPEACTAGTSFHVFGAAIFRVFPFPMPSQRTTTSATPFIERRQVLTLWTSIHQRVTLVLGLEILNQLLWCNPEHRITFFPLDNDNDYNDNDATFMYDGK